MRGRQTVTAYCQDPNCKHWDGIETTFTGDTWLQPGEWEPNECPACGGPLEDTRPDWENVVAATVNELQCAGVLPVEFVVDTEALFAAIHREVTRQMDAEARRKQAATIAEFVERYGALPF